METRPFIEHKKYRWFFTSSNKLVVGGKSSEQNDDLLKKLKGTKKDYVVMHTSSPGSPFSVIVEDPSEIKESDIEETAIFTGCFSRAWKLRKKKAFIDIFKLSQIYKSPKMKTGTWGVKGGVLKKTVTLELALTKQENKLRAVPIPTVKNKKNILLKFQPGKIDKVEMLPKIQLEIKESLSQDELLSALPAGGVAIVRK